MRDLLAPLSTIGLRGSPEPGSRRIAFEVAVVAGLTLAAALPRLVDLHGAPPGLHGDEGWMGIEALRILRDGPIGIWSPSALGQPAGPFYWTAAVFLFLEPSIGSVRLSTALLGVLTVPGAYVFYRVLFGPRVAFFGAALLAMGFWHLVYSRIAFPPVALPFVEVIALAALFVAFRRDTLPLYLLAGALLGLGAYTYIPYPFLAIGVAVFLSGWAGAELGKGRPPKEVGLRVGALAVGGLAVAGPFLLFLFQHPAPYAGYGRNTLIPLMDADAGKKIMLLGRQAFDIGSSFFRARPIDLTDAMGAWPLLDIITRVLFVTGLALAVWRWRDRRYLFLLVVLFFALLPGILSGESWGENRRTVAAIPIVYLLAGLGLSELLGLAVAGLPRSRPALYAWTGGLFLAITTINLWTYFGSFTSRTETRWVFAEEIAAACELLGARGDAADYVYFYAGRWTYRYETCRFLAPDLAAEDRSREFGTFSLVKTREGPVLYVFIHPYIEVAPAVEATYPGGTRSEGRGSDGRLLYITYRVP